MIWRELKNAVVRDLAWACFSPSLVHSPQRGQPDINNAGISLTPALIRAFHALDDDPSPLQQHLARQKGSRLGLYFEYLWQFMLDWHPETTLVAHNLAIRNNGQTLGEFDCLYYCHRRHIHVHLELAVKFYLWEPDNACWLGPEARDQLELKLAHLWTRQIQLSRQQEARGELDRLGIGEPRHEIEIKGYLFSRNQHFILPQGYNAENPVSRWSTVDEFLPELSDTGRGVQWLQLPKKQWLAPCRTVQDQDTEPLSEERLRTHFSEQFRPILVALCDANGERERRFITGSHWPQLSLPRSEYA